MKNVITTQYGRIHYLAGCHDCGWDAGIKTDATPTHADVRNAVRRHVRKTGHKCWIECGTHTEYQLDEAVEPLRAADAAPGEGSEN